MIRIPVPLSGSPAASDYEVLVGGGLRRFLPHFLESRCPAFSYALITDDTVARLYGTQLLADLRTGGLRVELFSFPAGEEHKTRESWAALCDAMLEAGIGRDGAVIALGGGVVGDLAGFVAATYMRGLPWVQVPTTLLAMIDASVGGKTGVDTHAGKNLVGAFHPPRLVATDLEVLRTLPSTQLGSGLAEAVKHGAIADADYLAWIADSVESLLAADPAALQRLIVRSVEIKAAMVARDERESGPRKALNFGHTIGHAVEAASGYRLLHGEAVAIGMMVEARIGEALGVTQQDSAAALQSVLTTLVLSTRLPPGIRVEEVLAGTRSDKKARAGRAEYALLERVGGPVIVSPVADDIVRKCVSA